MYSHIVYQSFMFCEDGQVSLTRHKGERCSAPKGYHYVREDYALLRYNE